tara:strand:+ start:164 stop:577 length:414 start_codon:yes stop_codon:yes gene_type:complete
MRNLLSMLLVFSFLFTIGCDDDEATDETNPLVGVYNMVSYSVSGDGFDSTQVADANNSLVFVLSEGGTYSLQGTIDGDSNSESGTWSTTGSTLTLITENDDDGTVTDIFSYTLSGNDMTMVGSAGGDFTITYNWEKE